MLEEDKGYLKYILFLGVFTNIKTVAVKLVETLL